MEHLTAWVEWLVLGSCHELMLFASVGILLIGLDDLLFDAFWIAICVVSHNRQLQKLTAESSRVTGPLAVFIPAWDEESVIAAMLSRSLALWGDEDVRLFVGCYPNDPATLFAVSALATRSEQICMVVAPHMGPTTKADNLNQLWHAMVEEEKRGNFRFAAIILHDAEDIIHAGELSLYRQYLANHSMIQIPVVPVIDPSSRWIGGHYADEFAEAHGKEMPLRAHLNLPLPSAGVGCAISRSALALLAVHREGHPFCADSLTEDYELGLMISKLGMSSSFVEALHDDDNRVVSRSVFPAKVETAVRQKSRWIAGIAFAGWDRLGWLGLPDNKNPMGSERSWLAKWMLWRDRRAPLSALILLVAYSAICLAGLGLAGQAVLGWKVPSLGKGMVLLLAFNFVLLLWRLSVRSYFTARSYGWQQGVLAVPRAFVSNIIAILAARRALVLYCRMLLSRSVVWDKTPHEAPAFTQENISSPGTSAR